LCAKTTRKKESNAIRKQIRQVYNVVVFVVFFNIYLLFLARINNFFLEASYT